MKVLLVNGSPNKEGCTNRALREITDTLEKENIETEIMWLGRKPISGCTACRACQKLGTCVIKDVVCEFLVAARDADGFIFGSPVHYAGASGSMTSFLDRVFYAEMAGNGNKSLYLKPGAAVVSARRGGTTAAFDQLNKYFTIQEMPVISSRYWNMVHGNTPEEVEQDLEGLYVMRVLARNMAYHLRCKEAAEKAGVARPEEEARVITNFIR
ncbi:flavodoxin family protein [Aminipila butyrica]|uniref:Flavodoxin family protein n=1 Tax=Aminipila butyrica TaxID=433296 RepID=A0A858BTR9_9FIRM|nr:flavodoxin family protein [Aminipila butyrica]QIB68742.1 flavodoxin family protein [Aminipila butyrica]